jgi:transcriptional regulator with XRE-family HTH domain
MDRPNDPRPASETERLGRPARRIVPARGVVERESNRIARLDAARLAEELRELRLGLGVSQRAVARLVGVSQSVISDLEAGDPTVRLDVRRRTAIALGADLRVNVYPGSTPLLHDAAHARIIERLLARRHRRWQAQLEARVPGQGRASTDVRLSSNGTIVLIEVETHVRRWEATMRACFDKRERVVEAAGDHTNVFAVLCLPPTRHHRSLVADLGETVRTAFPANPDDLRRSLEEGLDWPGDGILWVAGSPA